jgi:hypothetical protein
MLRGYIYNYLSRGARRCVASIMSNVVLPASCPMLCCQHHVQCHVSSIMSNIMLPAPCPMSCFQHHVPCHVSSTMSNIISGSSSLDLEPYDGVLTTVVAKVVALPVSFRMTSRGPSWLFSESCFYVGTTGVARSS